jgi:rubrerythrin
MTGWICPKCGSVYAPFVAECAVCNGFIKTGTTVTHGADTSICPACGQHRSASPLTGCPMGSHYGTFFLQEQP